MSFEKEYFCIFLNEDIKLHELAKEYHEQCEAYDKLVCRARTKKGVAMPNSLSEHSLITANAKWLWSVLQKEAENLGYSKDRWSQAVSKYHKVHGL